MSSTSSNPNGGILHAFTQPTPEFKDYHSWYNTEHGPLRVALDFIEGGDRYECYYADPEAQITPPIYLAMYELSRLSGLDEKQYTVLTDERSKREDDVFKNRLTFLERRIYKNLSTRGTYTGPAPILLTVAFVLKDEHVDEFNRWYEEVSSTPIQAKYSFSLTHLGTCSRHLKGPRMASNKTLRRRRGQQPPTGWKRGRV